MNWYDLSDYGNNYKRGAVALGLIVVLFLLLNRPSTPTISAWRGENPSVAGLSGSAIQVGQGDTLVAPPGISSDQPWGNPVAANRVVMTQGYGVGSHAPAEVWGQSI